ncbi:MAG: SRPBCC domain-containing protein [Actinomycetota bacterium]|nr:SRPBCC domain-containing protein [Actinomycetota bacterium]
MIEPLQLSFEVACDAGHAFDVWTRDIASWWPPDHTVSGERGTTVILERRLGGRIFERTSTGQESDWGEITAWDPPARLAYAWHIGADRADATDVEIAFVAVSDLLTRVEVVHRGWERLGTQRGQERRNANRIGWDRVIPAYRERCETPRAS